MWRVVIAPAAEADIKEILHWTIANLGDLAAKRYRTLIIQALDDLGSDPMRRGSTVRQELSSVARTYHLSHSRKNVRPREWIVKSPRHFLVYRLGEASIVEVGRVLHDSMDVVRHVTDDFLP